MTRTIRRCVAVLIIALAGFGVAFTSVPAHQTADLTIGPMATVSAPAHV